MDVFTCYNSEGKANTLLEVNASQRDKDFIASYGKKVEKYVKSEMEPKCQLMWHTIIVITTKGAWRYPSVILGSPQSNLRRSRIDLLHPMSGSLHTVVMWIHGPVFLCRWQKLAAVVPVYSFEKMQQAIASKSFEGDGRDPVLKYDAVLQGEVKDAGLGPLHRI